MACSTYYENLIDKYVEGLVTVEEKEILESHIRDCSDCRREVEELQQIIQAAGSLEQVELPDDFTPKLMEKIKDLSYQQTSREKTPGLLSLIRNIPALLSSYYYNNKRTFVAVMSVLLLGIFVVTVYNLSPFHMNYATKSAKENAAYELAPAGDTPMMMMSEGAGMSDQRQIESESITQVPQTNIADAGLKTFSAEERSQKIIKSADISIYVEKFDEKIDEIVKIVEELGGYIENSQIQGGKSADVPRRAYMALRIPQAKLNDALDKFKAMGRVAKQQTRGENITDAYYDTDARIRNLVKQEERLLEILNMAKNVDEILRIENELNRVRTDIEVLTGQLTAWDKMVEMSLVNVDLIEQEPSKEKVATISILELLQRAKQGFIAAINLLLNILTWLAEVIGALLPIALILGIIFLIVKRFFNKKNPS